MCSYCSLYNFCVENLFFFSFFFFLFLFCSITDNLIHFSFFFIWIFYNQSLWNISLLIYIDGKKHKLQNQTTATTIIMVHLPCHLLHNLSTKAHKTIGNVLRYIFKIFKNFCHIPILILFNFSNLSIFIRFHSVSDDVTSFGSAPKHGDGSSNPFLEENQHKGCQKHSFCRALGIPGVFEFAMALFFAKFVAYMFIYWLPYYLGHLKFSTDEAANISSYFDLGGKYSKRRRSNVAVIIVRIVFICSFLFQCLLCNHSFQTNPNSSTNFFKLILFL